MAGRYFHPCNPKTSTPVSGNLLSYTSFLSKVLAGQAPAVKYPARVEGPSSSRGARVLTNADNLERLQEKERKKEEAMKEKQRRKEEREQKRMQVQEEQARKKLERERNRAQLMSQRSEFYALMFCQVVSLIVYVWFNVC